MGAGDGQQIDKGVREAGDRRVSLPFGLATAIGSLPHFDPGEAVDFVLRHVPGLPAAPSLPARSPREGMLAQAATGMHGVRVTDEGSLVLDLEVLDPETEPDDVGFGGDAFVGLRAFLTAVADRSGPIKVQLTGPVTLGIGLNMNGAPVDVAFAAAGVAVRARAAALLRLLEERVPQCTPVVFLDEPGLVGALDPDFPLPTETALDLVSSTLAVLEHGAITGVHCCGKADWNAVLQAGPQILSLPIDADVESSAGAFAQHLERGGWFAWGAVPTDRPIGSTPELLWRELSQMWCRLVQDGCDPVRLRTQALITPVCGLASHGVTQAEQVMEFTAQLADRLHDQAIGVRLSVGA
jgi:methionine synthase II (cobalamin-independent)